MCLCNCYAYNQCASVRSEEDVKLLELTLSLMVRPGIVADVTDFRLLVYNELKHGESDSNPILHSEIANPPASFSQPGNRQSSGTAAVISLSSRA